MVNACSVKEGADLIAALSIPGTLTSMPKIALPLHLAGALPESHSS
jgi:hypothetical protein